MSQARPILGLTSNPLVYFVDDEPEIVKIFRAFFEDCFADQYQLMTFDNPHEAFACATRPGARIPDAIVTDFRMPKMSGLDLISRFQNAGITCGAILLSGHLDRDDAIEAANRGIRHIIRKPLDGEKLVAALQSLLANQQEQRLKRDIRTQILRLKEMYSAMRLLMSTRGPEFDDVLHELLLDPQMPDPDQKFVDVLEDLERNLDHLLRSEDFLSHRRSVIEQQGLRLRKTNHSS